MFFLSRFKTTAVYQNDSSEDVRTACPLAETTVGKLLDDPLYGWKLRFTGKLLDTVGHNRYRFSDGTGEITARINQAVFGEQAVFMTSEVEIAGELKRTMAGEHILKAGELKLVHY